jgi:F0F1-type ATP synthase delta subunit
MEENFKEVEEKLNEYLNDPSVKTEEEKKFMKDVVDKLKTGEVPVDTILGKFNESMSSLDNLKKTNPEFESFVSHYQSKISDAMKQFNELLKNQASNKV